MLRDDLPQLCMVSGFKMNPIMRAGLNIGARIEKCRPISLRHIPIGGCKLA